MSLPRLVRLAAAALLACACVRLEATSVGDTYDQVLKEKGDPRSSMEAGSTRVLSYPDATIKVRDGRVVSIKVIAPSPTPTPSPTVTAAPVMMPAPGGVPPEAIADLQKQLKDAIAAVVTIVNQPVTSVPLTPEIQAKASHFPDGWFHPGAEIPDFMLVDVRSTQDIGSYSGSEYVTTSLKPGVAFLSAQLEFNAKTKFFYKDRTLPKKRLTQAEMEEINRLYRIIGRCRGYLKLMGVESPW